MCEEAKVVEEGRLRLGVGRWGGEGTRVVEGGKASVVLMGFPSLQDQMVRKYNGFNTDS